MPAMSISLYDALVPNFRQTIGASLALLDKAEAWGAEKGLAAADIIGHRLAPDMAQLPFQVKSVADHSIGALEGVRAGLFTPSAALGPQDFPALKALLADAETALAALDPAEVNALAGKDMIFQLRDMRLPFTAENFLFSFSVPNFYFHATTLYDILRNKGLPLGKRDFLGALRMKI
jgi:hypothetical protein